MATKISKIIASSNKAKLPRNKAGIIKYQLNEQNHLTILYLVGSRSKGVTLDMPRIVCLLKEDNQILPQSTEKHFFVEVRENIASEIKVREYTPKDFFEEIRTQKVPRMILGTGEIVTAEVRHYDGEVRVAYLLQSILGSSIEVDQEAADEVIKDKFVPSEVEARFKKVA